MIVGRTINYNRLRNPVAAHRARVADPLRALSLDFAAQSYTIGGRPIEDVQQLLTVQRATPKWVWNATGQLVEVPVDEPAYDHDPVTGEPLGLLVESSRTNIYTDNISMTPANGVSGAVVTKEVGQASPITPDKGVRITTTGGDSVRKWSTGDFGSTRERLRWTVWLTNNGGYPVRLNGESSTIGASDYVEPGETKKLTLIKSSSDNGYRGIRLEAESPSDDTDVTIVGVMLQQSPDAVPSDTSIIFTDGAAATRAADNASIDLSDVFNPDEGTLRITAQVPEGEVVASLGDMQVVSDSDEFKAYRMTYSDYTGVPTVTLGNGIHSKLEYFPEAQS